MKSTYLIILFALFGYSLRAQQILVSNNARVSFFSSTVVEDIEGISNTGSSVIDAKTGNLIFRVNNTSFQFKKKLMQEHFNENYMESEKYPVSAFKGALAEPLNLNLDGVRTVMVEGNLTIHGVTKNYKTKAEITVSKGSLIANAVFKVKIADHGIEIPTLVFKNIAEYVEVRIKAEYKAKK